MQTRRCRVKKDEKIHLHDEKLKNLEKCKINFLKVAFVFGIYSSAMIIVHYDM